MRNLLDQPVTDYKMSSVSVDDMIEYLSKYKEQGLVCYIEKDSDFDFHDIAIVRRVFETEEQEQERLHQEALHDVFLERFMAERGARKQRDGE